LGVGGTSLLGVGGTSLLGGGGTSLLGVGDRLDGADKPPSEIQHNRRDGRKHNKEELLDDDKRVGGDREKANNGPSELPSGERGWRPT